MSITKLKIKNNQTIQISNTIYINIIAIGNTLFCGNTILGIDKKKSMGNHLKNVMYIMHSIYLLIIDYLCII